MRVSHRFRLERASVRLASLAAVVLIAASAAGQDARFRAGGLVLSAPGGPQASAGILRIAELRFVSRIVSGQPTDMVTVFAPDQPAIFAWFRHVGGQPGVQLNARLVFLAPAGETEASVVSVALAQADDVGYFKFTRGAEPWARGRYRVDLSTGGTRVASGEFEVRPR